MWPGAALTYIWYPVTLGRHAFPAADREKPHEEKVTAYCGAQTSAAELHGANELDWIRETTCMACWRIIAARTG